MDPEALRSLSWRSSCIWSCALPANDPPAPPAIDPIDPPAADIPVKCDEPLRPVPVSPASEPPSWVSPPSSEGSPAGSSSMCLRLIVEPVVAGSSMRSTRSGVRHLGQGVTVPTRFSAMWIVRLQAPQPMMMDRSFRGDAEAPSSEESSNSDRSIPPSAAAPGTTIALLQPGHFTRLPTNSSGTRILDSQNSQANLGMSRTPLSQSVPAVDAEMC